MAREHETTSKQQLQQQKWGTLEELLLACAVNRHGTKSWDSIAMEVANRSSNLAAASLTPQNCKDKFNDLKRRFMSQNDAESASLVPLVDRLRQIRVQELRAEVQRRDVSIVSLELKVKRLEEERERSLKAETDLERGRKAESTKIVAGKLSAVDGDGDSDDRENRSYNESNSTTQKAETTNNKQNDDVEVEEEEQEKEPNIKPKPEVDNEPVPIRTASEPDREDRDWLSNGRLNENGNGNGNGSANVKDEEDDEDNAKTTSRGKKNKRSQVGGVSESNELWDESKREGKQSSDVQSSASLSRNKKSRRGEGDGAAAGCSSGEEPDTEEVSRSRSRSRSRSPARKRALAVKSELLVKVMGIIRSHRLGSHFERRLRSQESERYKKLIRQHIDLRTIQSRLDGGTYSDSFHKFFRDLLLLFNNFIIFFRKSSQEYAAAKELRALVVKEMNDKLRKPKPITVKPKTEPEQQPQQQRRQPVSLSGPNRASTMVVCGKRSAIKATTENNANANGRKGDKKEREVEEKTKLVENEKKVDNSFAGIEEKGGIKKKRSKERWVSGRGNSKSGNKSDGGEVKHQYGGNELSSHDGLEVKNVYSKKESAARKKQGAAIFLRRMKQNSSPNKVVEDDNDDDYDDNEEDEEEEEESKDSKVEEEKKRRSSERKKDVKRDRVTRSSRGRGVREESGRTRRGVGRPPKRSERAAATTTTGKRGRDNGQSEAGGGSGRRSKKRTRK